MSIATLLSEINATLSIFCEINVFIYYSSTETSVITASTATAGLAPASSSATSSGNINIET